MQRLKTTYKSYARLAVIIIAAAMMGSCQKVIHVKLNSADAQVVIQAYVTDQPLQDTVLITKTGDYFTPGNYAHINNALVIVSDNAGITDTFMQVDSGKYAATRLTGVPGRTYSMRVDVDGKEYNAVTTMPMPVVLDSLIATGVGTPPDSSLNILYYAEYHIHCFFYDPAATVNYYRLQAYVNGVLQDSTGDITVYEDKYTNGLLQSVRVRMPNPAYHDSVRVDLMSIDADTYKYFSVLRSISGSSNPISTATPQNPPTNILGGALGYFSAYSVSTKSMLVQ